MSGIPFEEWVGVDQHAARLRAGDSSVKPLAVRVMFAAIGWSNLIGHAEFAAQGLANILLSSNPRTGELSIPSRRQVNAAIRRAEEMGLVAEGSSRFCLLAPDWWEKAGGTGGKTCTHHGIRPRARRDKRSPAQHGDRDKRSPAPGQILSRPEPLTCANVTPLYDSDLPQPTTSPQPGRKPA